MRLIDATRIEQYILNNCSDNEEINAIYAEIINAPTIEAEPIKHGHWINKGLEPLRCSECGIMVDVYNEIPWACKSFVYCPNCGAKMDEVNENETY